MIKLTLQYEWRPPQGKGSVLDARLFEVLYAVHESGSIAAAARETGMSYRHVWGLTGTWERRLGRPLVTLKKGRGAKLTEFGRKLLWAQELVQARLAPDFDSLRHEIEAALAHGADEDAPRLSVCASHDLALAQLRDRLAQGDGLKLDLRFQGSLESLAALAREQCDLAGFHLAEGLDERAAAQFARALDARRHRLIGLATRTQGLMLARGNPKAIASLADLVRPGVRFVNRQRGSGSRLELDQLLAGAGIDASRIDGYQNEEFTHLAVAATIAGGRADAGFGVKAAAAEYELDFLPLLTERYYLAGRREKLAALQPLLGGEAFAAILARLPGYGNAITGQVFEIAEALPAARSARPLRRRAPHGARAR
ncbi:MAG: substrate-binding domain-containing protein [Burkholderiales bacterium]